MAWSQAARDAAAIARRLRAKGVKRVRGQKESIAHMGYLREQGASRFTILKRSMRFMNKPKFEKDWTAMVDKHLASLKKSKEG